VRFVTAPLAVVVLGLALIWPASSFGVVTLGSDLSHNPDMSWGCGGMACTASPITLPGRTVVSPVNGRVITWRVGGGSSGPAVNARLRVIDPLGLTDLFRSSSALGSVPPGFGIYTFSSSVPISIGDRIGLDDDHAGGGNLGGYSGSTGTYDVFQPIVADGATVAPAPGGPGVGELLFNADVVPNGVFLHPKKPKTKKSGTATIKFPAPNPGLLQIVSRGFIEPITRPISAPGDVKLKLNPTRTTRKKLRRNGRAKGGITLTFTPVGGDPTSQTLKLKLRLG
jgi:hypothetical protein